MQFVVLVALQTWPTYCTFSDTSFLSLAVTFFRHHYSCILSHNVYIFLTLISVQLITSLEYYFFWRGKAAFISSNGVAYTDFHGTWGEILHKVCSLKFCYLNTQIFIWLLAGKWDLWLSRGKNFNGNEIENWSCSKRVDEPPKLRWGAD